MARLVLKNRFRGLSAGTHDFAAVRVRRTRAGTVKSYQVANPVTGATVNIPANRVKSELPQSSG